jgi:probable HAF family extracellular repeat protein
MKLSCIVRFACISTLAGAANTAMANSYTIVDLGTYRYAYGINDDGHVAGWGTDKKGAAGVWKNGRWHRLGVHASTAHAINGRGDVVGQNDEGMPELWLRNGSGSVVNMPNGFQGSIGQANSIAQDGTIVGSFLVATPENENHCFLTDPEGNSVDLAPNDTDCIATDVNLLHQVVGTATYAFLWQDGKFTDLGTLPGGRGAQAESINQQGQIVGEADTPTSTGHAFLWSEGTMVDLADGADYRWSIAETIDTQGHIVGQAQAADLSYHAVRFSGGQVIDLESEIVNLDDWELDDARSVNNDGVIVGTGSRKNVDGHGHRPPDRLAHAFMLVPANEHK